MKINRKRMVWIIVGLAALAVSIQLSVVIGIEYVQLKNNATRLAAYRPSEKKQTR